MLHVLGEVFYISGIILNLWVYLSPTPWASEDPNASALKFTPYNEPVGYTPPNPCGSPPVSPSTVAISYGGVSNAVNYSNVAVWIGPLGSCSRDQDGAVHCTKSSYSNPQYNMTYVQPNTVYFPQNMIDNIAGGIIRGFTFLHCIMFGLYLFVSVSYWSPVTTSRLFGVTKPGAPAGLLMMLFIVHVLAACVEFFFNFTILPDNLNVFNSIDNFYDPAPCGHTRPLKSGILLKAQPGKMYHIMWVAWCLIYLIANMLLLWRWGWVAGNYEKMTTDDCAKRTEVDLERAAAKGRKEQDNLHSGVEEEEEKFHIRATALAELKAEAPRGIAVPDKGKEFEASCEAKSVCSSCTDTVPPYRELTSPK